jgi:hypothetical protein
MRGLVANILIKPAGRIVTLVLAVVILIILLPLLHVLPRLGSLFTQSSVQRSSSVVLQSITRMSRYEAASGSFQVLVDIKHVSKLPSFLSGSDTVYVGQGSDIAYVDFSRLSGRNIRLSADRTAATVRLPQPQLAAAQLNLKGAHVFTEQEGLLTRLGSLFDSSMQTRQQHAVYVQAQSRLQAAARQSALVADARRNTTAMLASLLRGLGFTRVTVTFGTQRATS